MRRLHHKSERWPGLVIYVLGTQPDPMHPFALTMNETEGKGARKAI